ncbi:ABATE domain-containing protein [Stenotrophomonas rhizophila]
MIDSPPSAALFVANDLALDFINSAYGPSAAPVDVLQGDQAAIDWLAAAGVLGRRRGRHPERHGGAGRRPARRSTRTAGGCTGRAPVPVHRW